jgi:hypothetical protein
MKGRAQAIGAPPSENKLLCLSLIAETEAQRKIRMKGFERDLII